MASFTFRDSNSQIVTIDVPNELRARLYVAYLRTALEALENGPGSKAFFAVAVNGAGILSGLATLLDLYVLAPVAAMMKTNNFTQEQLLFEYPGRVTIRVAPIPGVFPGSITETVMNDKRRQTALKELFLTYPITAYALDQVTSQFVALITQACERITADRADIETAFFAGATITRLRKITCTGSDLHKGGKQVLLLQFDVVDATSSAGRLVYKPADVEIDYLLVGDTSRVGYTGGTYVAGQAGSVKSASEILNEGFDDDDIDFPTDTNSVARHVGNVVVTRRFRVPTYVILPRNPGSGLDLGSRNVLPIRESYGYIQFLSHDPGMKSDGAPLTTLARATPWDWIGATGQETKDYCCQAGALMALAVMFSIHDMHMDNVIVHEQQPHLIDLEISCKHSVKGRDSIDLPGGLKVFHMDKQRLDIGTEIGLVGQREYGKNKLLKTDGNAVNIDTYQDDLDWGFDAAMWVFSGGKKTDFKNFVAGAPFAKAVARALPFGTDLLQSFHQHMFVTKFDYHDNGLDLVDGLADKIDLLRNTASIHIRSIFTNHLATYIEDAKQRDLAVEPDFAVLHVNHAMLDIFECDIPCFYHRVGERHLLNSRGERILVPTVNASNQLTFTANTEFFPAAAKDLITAKFDDL